MGQIWAEFIRHPVGRALGCIAVLLLLTGCGLTVTNPGLFAGDGDSAVSVSVTGPASVTLGNQSQYSAVVTGSSDTAVSWTVNGVAGGNAVIGLITATGLYTAPAAMPSSTSTVSIAATSAASISASRSISVTLAAPPTNGGNPAPPTVSIALTGPSNATLGKQYQYTATVSGSSNGAVVWTVNGTAGGSVTAGTITIAGLYTAPAAMPSSSTVTVTATSAADPGVSQSMVVTLAAPPPGTPTQPTLTVVVSGASSVGLGAPAQYSATVSGSSNKTVTWTVNGIPGGNIEVGLISADGLYTAPATMPASPTVAVAATSVANPTVSQSLAVTLELDSPPPVKTPTPPPTADATSVTISGPATVNAGTPVQYAAKVAGTANQAVTWSISPAEGSISAAGLYVPPSAVPAANRVTVKAVSSQTPSVFGTLTITLLDPVPVITSAVATAQGSTQNYLIDVQGNAFLQGATLLMDGQAVTTTQVSANELKATIAGGSAQQVTVIVENPNPGETQSAPVTVPLKASQTSATAAARLLDQATFGPTELAIEHVEAVGLQGYLTEQINTPPSLIQQLTTPPPSQCSPPVDTVHCVQSAWFQIALTGNDQLRQRVALGLSELWVASSSWGYQVIPYQNMLVQDAFTNYRTIMQDVTLSPNMGNYLNMLGNVKPATGQIANENYAREMMQLFTMGTNLLNEDGTLQLDAHGNPISAYTQAQVQAFARAYTGWTSANADGSTPPGAEWPVQNWTHPMVAVDRQHDTSAKALLNGVTLPAGQTAEEDLTQALDNVFNHPNVGPFVSRQLIQHLVTGNPSPAYIKRVAAVFADNGRGVRGDMKAIITAILLDPEARAADTQTGDELETNPAVDGGHLREPLLWIANIFRGLGATSSNTDSTNHYPWVTLIDLQTRYMNEPQFLQPTVFNFFSPSYVIAGTAINSPEFGIENTGATMPRLNFVNYALEDPTSGVSVDFSASGRFGSKAGSPEALVDYLDLIFMHSQMPTDMRNAIVEAVSSIPASNPAERARVATYLVVTSSQYKVMP